MSNPFSLNGWLRRQPQPVTVIVERDGKPDMRVEVGKDGRNWRNLQQTLAGLAPYVRLTLLNGQSETIRAKAFEDEDEVADAPNNKDGDTEIVVFARLLTEATKDQPILKHAMEFIAQLSTNVSQLMADNERLRGENNRLRLHVGELQLTPAEGDEGSVMALLGQMAKGAKAGAITRPKLQQVSAPGPKVTK